MLPCVATASLLPLGNSNPEKREAGSVVWFVCLFFLWQFLTEVQWTLAFHSVPCLTLFSSHRDLPDKPPSTFIYFFLTNNFEVSCAIPELGSEILSKSGTNKQTATIETWVLNNFGHPNMRALPLTDKKTESTGERSVFFKEIHFQ